MVMGGCMVVGGRTVLYWRAGGRRPARVGAPSIVGVPSHCRAGSWCRFLEILQERELSVSTIFEQPVVFFVTLKTTHGTPADSVAHRWPRSFRNRFRLFNLGFQFFYFFFQSCLHFLFIDNLLKQYGLTC